MTHRVAVAARIREGKRDELSRRLAEGPPFDLAARGFTGHQAFLGEHTVVFVFEGAHPHSDLRDLAGWLPLGELTRMSMLVKSPELLAGFHDWPAADSPDEPWPQAVVRAPVRSA